MEIEPAISLGDRGVPQTAIEIPQNESRAFPRASTQLIDVPEVLAFL
jgi:hypothetical protein